MFPPILKDSKTFFCKGINEDDYLWFLLEFLSKK